MPDNETEIFEDIVLCLHHLSARVVWPDEAGKRDFQARLRAVSEAIAPSGSWRTAPGPSAAPDETPATAEDAGEYA